MDDFLDFTKFITVLVLIVAAIIGIGISPWLIWGDSRVPEIKLAAEKAWAANGFKVLGYQGYELGLFSTPGGCVWYTLKRDATVYQGCLSRWGNEYHIYSLSALNAVKGN